MSEKLRKLKVEKDDGSWFEISVPATAKITFGPWSPPSRGGGGMYNPTGTLRVYDGTKSTIVALFSGVRSFHDESMKIKVLPKAAPPAPPKTKSGRRSPGSWSPPSALTTSRELVVAAADMTEEEVSIPF